MDRKELKRALKEVLGLLLVLDGKGSWGRAEVRMGWGGGRICTDCVFKQSQ